MSSYNRMPHWDWVESGYKVKCSPLGRRVAFILGMTFGGIYNAPVPYKIVKWDRPNGIIVPLSSGRHMATFDNNSLTTLVMMAHELAIRVEVRTRLIGHMIDRDDFGDCEILDLYDDDSEGHVLGADYHSAVLELGFWQRTREGNFSSRHPSIEQAAADFRDWFDDTARELMDGTEREPA